MSPPPTYTPLSRSPSYTSLPVSGEERLGYTPRPGASLTHENYIRSWQHVTIVLANQDGTARQPSYGQGSVVSGEVRLHTPQTIQRVSLKLEGHASLSLADGPSRTLDIMSSKAVLWAKDAPTEPHDEPCPPALAFCFQFPQTFTYERRAFKLPPSFEAAFLETPVAIVKCAYVLRVSLALSRKYRLATWAGTNNKSYSLTLHYLPRARSEYSLHPARTVISTIKTHPNEWLQLQSTMNVRPNAEVKPIDCHFILPAASVYALVDTIPFHIHLCGSPASLRILFPYMCSVLSPEHNSTDQQQTFVNPIQVLISRQVVVDAYEQRSIKNRVIGTGKVWPLPPPPGGTDEISREISASWEGEIRLKDVKTVPGFNIGNILVKDYIMLVLTPPKGRSSPLYPLEMVHPIRLVTDPWIEDHVLHPQDT